ncbi:putative T7SS-secreted protein [Streptomyces sp. NPDC089173]|uniref:putative T7SS-secreted protein n=1 Tax=Streptomyces sp. NPDC089173 TaxID=3154965 RepID=UPI0034502AB5
MGFGDFVRDITPDVVEDAVEDGVEWAGDRVEDAGNWTGDRLEDAGWESGADWVREKSRSVANRMGAEVDEMDLGQTEDKTKLIYGSPSEIRSTATHLRKLQGAFDKVGGGLKEVDSSALKGQAADAFRSSVSVEPPKWFNAADAFEKAAGALDAFAGTVEWAQGQAQTAIDKWKAGTKASEEARDAYNEKTTTYNKAVDVYNAKPADERDPSTLPPKPGTFSDPGTARMKEAQELLAEARKQRNTAAETARKAVTAARDAAPQKPRYAEQAMDGLAEYQVIKTHLAGGVVKGAAGILNFARSVNPTDPYNITHPAEYGLALNNTAAGLVRVANDPWGTGKQMIDGFMKDPAEGFGRLLPDVVLTVATGGAGAGVKGARVIKEVADIASDARRLERAAPEGTHNRPDGERTTGGTDPVDLASGRMFLPQTDVVLPGVLPLAFTRRAESGYTAGRFFGPSWSSTVDERLEIDAVGVIHVTDDGLLITYPHPVPGLPTLPESGTSRSALSRDDAGDYTLTDPETRLTKHFTGPPWAEPGEDGTAWLVQITDRNSNTITLDRAADGTPLALVHSADHRLVLTVAEARVTGLSLMDGTGAVHPLRSYGYASGNLSTITQPSGSALTFEYDDARRITAWTDSNRSRYVYVYDEHDRVIAAGGEAGHVELALSYGHPIPATGHRVTTLTTADGHATRHLIDARCRVLATTDPLGHTTRSTYDSHGRHLTRTDPLGRVTDFTYDEQGHLLTVTRPDGSRLTTKRDPSGSHMETRGPDGGRRLQEFDEKGNLTALTDAAGHTTRWNLDAQGRPASVTDALGATTTIHCDAAGMPTEVKDPAGGTTHVKRDVLGRPVRITDPAGGTTRLEWDVDGRLARRVAPGGATESWTYDGEGNCLTYTDPVGGVSSFDYTHFDLPAARTHSDGARYSFRYDAHLQLTQVVNPRGMTWNYSYDAAGRMISETDFDGRTVSYHYDADGQLSSRTDALGQTISFKRDQLGRVIEKDADGQVTVYTYDQAGRLLQASSPDSELLYRYDRRGQVKTELVDGYAMAYAYDAVGRRTRRTTPTGQVTAYAYDSSGRPAHLTAGGCRVGFTHDVAGRETARVFGGFLTVASAWDEAGRLSAEELTADGRALNGRSYSYRSDGHLTELSDRLSGSRTFGLDAVGRVTAVHARGWKERYAYDADGNQTEAVWPDTHPGSDGAGPRSYTGTKLIRAGGTRFEYDALGRVTLRRRARLSRKPEIWRYTWDAESRLTSVITPDGTRWRYRYDPLGRRTAKQRLSTDGGTVVEEVRFAWDGLTLCEQTMRESALPNTVVLTWDHRAGVPLAQTERILTADTRQDEIDRRFFAIATDLVGAPTELVDESGDIAWRTRTTIWGTTAWARTSTTYTPLRFPGQYYDPETGLHYNLFRHYDPEAGRYVSPDPLGLAPGPNPVAYVDNPFTWCDPLGLMPKCPKERAQKVSDQVIERAQEGKMRKSGNYHADTRHQFSDDRVLEILKNPDAVYHSQGQRGNLTFRQGEDVVITKGPGAGAGDVITAYGPSGIRGESGAKAFGGSPDDPGLPVTHDDIVNGNIPDSRGGTLAPAEQIR